MSFLFQKGMFLVVVVPCIATFGLGSCLSWHGTFFSFYALEIFGAAPEVFL